MIRETKTYILQLISSMLMLLLTLTACSTDDDSQRNNPVLKIYVYSPDHPIVTRVDNPDPDVNPIAAESAINTLQVWVFEHHEPSDQDSERDGKFVGYISTNGNDISSETNQGTLVMNITDPYFIQNRPNVDVYVAANVKNANCGFTLSENSTRANLIAAKIGDSKFGVKSVSAVVKAVPDDGLPMSGVLINQPISGTAPIFGVGTEGNLAKVKLVRAVSKMRFVFCCIDDDVTHKVKSISLDGTKIYKSEYLFLDDEYLPTGGPGYRYKVDDDISKPFVGGTPTIMNTQTTIHPMTSTDKDPSFYDWTNQTGQYQTGQAYETLIAENLIRIVDGVKVGDLNDLGTYYLHESDKQVEGTITYLDNSTEKSATFKIGKQLEFLPGDFGRNHTWIVYAYFNYAKGLEVVTVKVNDWETTDPEEYEVYNW